jgi:Tfp pilus assembly protein PilV
MQNHPSHRAAAGRKRRRQAGFTIAEVAFATFVMALGIATSIIAMQAGFKQMDLARSTTIAAQILQSEMERLRMMSWTSLTALQTAYPTQTYDGATNFTTNSAVVGKYSVTRTISTDAANSEIKDITIAVTWSTYDGRSHSRAFTAIYAKNGLYDYYYSLAHPTSST